MSKPKLDQDLPDATAKILIAFCLQEHLHYPSTKKMFLEQSLKDQNAHLKYMQQVTGDPKFNYEVYKRFLSNQG